MAGGLNGIRVLVFARTAPAAFCTMTLADMGAEVIKVETPPSPDGKRAGGSGVSPDRATAKKNAFNYINRNKASIALDPRSVEGQAVLHRLVKTADVVVESFRPGVMKRLGADYESLRKINNGIVYCSLSGFGSDGPYKHKPGHDINYLAVGGTLSLIGKQDETPTVPLNFIGDFAAAAMYGTIGILVALVARRQTGEGQFVDVSFVDGVIALTAGFPGVMRYFLDGSLSRRGDHFLSGSFPYYAVYETKDGKYFTLGCYEQPFWDHFCEAIGRPDLLPFGHDPSLEFTGPNEAMLKAKAELEKIFKAKTRDEWFALLNDKDTCADRVLTWDEVFDDPQVRHRQMLVEVEDPVAGRVPQVGIPIKFSGTPGSIRRVAPYLGQDTDSLLANLGYTEQEITALRTRHVVY